MMTKVCPFLFRFVFGIVFMDCIVCIIQSLDNFVENRNLHYVFLRLRSSSEYISVSMPRGLISDRRHHIWKCDGCILFAMMCLSGAVLWNNVLFSMTVQISFHVEELSELNTETPFFWNSDHENTWIWVSWISPEWSRPSATMPSTIPVSRSFQTSKSKRKAWQLRVQPTVPYKYNIRPELKI